MEWNLVERDLLSEINFLKDHILTSPFRQDDPVSCNDCIFRLIALLVINGSVKLRKITYHKDSLWNSNEYQHENSDAKKHGQIWHSSKISLIKQYFEKKDHQVIDEGALFYGRSDLFVPNLNIYIEVGTINLYKLYMNLLTMKRCRVLLTPSDCYTLEFIL